MLSNHQQTDCATTAQNNSLPILNKLCEECSDEECEGCSSYIEDPVCLTTAQVLRNRPNESQQSSKTTGIHIINFNNNNNNSPDAISADEDDNCNYNPNVCNSVDEYIDFTDNYMLGLDDDEYEELENPINNPNLPRSMSMVDEAIQEKSNFSNGLAQHYQDEDNENEEEEEENERLNNITMQNSRDLHSIDIPPARSSHHRNNNNNNNPNENTSTGDESIVIVSVSDSTWPGALNEKDIGKRKPNWMDDDLSTTCSSCGDGFTFWRRRHHCRACGHLMCAQCCDWWMPLHFMKARARVCARCYVLLLARRNQTQPSKSLLLGTTRLVEQQQDNNSSNQKQQQRKRQQSTKNKIVSFSDGLRPGGDLQESVDGIVKVTHFLSNGQFRLSLSIPLQDYSTNDEYSLWINSIEDFHSCLLPSWEKDALTFGSIDAPIPLPPIAVVTSKDIKLRMVPSFKAVVKLLKVPNDENSSAEVLFALTRNCHVRVSRWNLISPSREKGQKSKIFHYWRFISVGLERIGQQEIALYLDCSGRYQREIVPPMCFMRLFHQILCFARHRTTDTSQVSPIPEFSTFVLENPLPFSCGGGLLLVNSRHHLSLPHFRGLTDLSPSCLTAILLHENELNLAKILPWRVLLRLGQHYKHYPWPFVSKRSRSSVYTNTIKSIISHRFEANLQIPHHVPGLAVHLTDYRSVLIKLPNSSLSHVMRVANQVIENNSTSLLLATRFTHKASVYAVCVENESKTNCETEFTTPLAKSQKHEIIVSTAFVLISMCPIDENQENQWNFLEDGIEIQLKSTSFKNVMQQLISGKNIQLENDNLILNVNWYSELIRTTHNHAVCWRSWIDGCDLLMDRGFSVLESAIQYTTGHQVCYRVPSEYQLRHSLRYLRSLVKEEEDDGTENCVPQEEIEIRYLFGYTRLFVIRSSEECEDLNTGESVDLLQFSEPFAQTFIQVLMPQISEFRASGIVGIALRIFLEEQSVGFSTGCLDWTGQNGIPLPHHLITDDGLSEALLPLLMQRSTEITVRPLELELIFHILQSS